MPFKTMLVNLINSNFIFLDQYDMPSLPGIRNGESWCGNIVKRELLMAWNKLPGYKEHYRDT